MNDSKSRRNFIAGHLDSVPRSGIRDFFEIVDTRDDVISLSIGEPDFVTPWHIREASIFALDRGATSYTANLGLLELRRVTADYVRKSYGLSYNPESEILITVGVSEAMDLAVRAIVDPGDEVIYHQPSYVSYAPVISFAHGTPVSVTTTVDTGFQLSRDMLEPCVTGKTKALLLNFPTNPTGAVLPPEEARALAEFAVEHDLVVITDEVYSELTYEGERVSVASFPGMKDRTIFLNGFSKAWAMTGFRIGFACAPPELTEAMMKLHQYTMMCAPILSQKAAIEAILNGSSDIEQMLGEYRKRRNFICASFEEMGLPCRTPGGTFYAFPYIGGSGMNSSEFALRLLDEEKVACVPGSAFGPAGEGFLRCCYAANFDDIREAMTRMARFVGRLT